jgi:hypothetical protein
MYLLHLIKTVWLSIYLFGTIFIILGIDYYKLDLSGHLYSAKSFLDVGLHGWDPSVFLGAIHNLFYPPLEDILLGVILRIFNSVHYLLIVKVYLVILWSSVCFLLYQIVGKFNNINHSLFLSITFCLTLLANKISSHSLQGLSLHDLVVSGLTSQFLGYIFFLFLINETLKNKTSSKKVIFWCLVLCFLSHIVIGAIALLLVSIFYFYQDKKDLPKIWIAFLGTTSFYWLPFVYFKEYMTSSNITLATSLPFFIFSLILFLCKFSLIKRNIYFLASFFLLAISSFAWILNYFSIIFFSFHYYRFDMPAIILLIIGLTDLLRKSTKQFSLVLSLSFLTILLFTIKFEIKDSIKLITSQKGESNYLYNSKIQNKLYEYQGRLLTIGNYRPIDFSVESLLQSHNLEDKTVKGLFWESNRTNILLSSYLATFFGGPSVLDYYYYTKLDCSVYSCLFESFIKDYQISNILLSNIDNFSNMSPEHRYCFREMFSQKQTTNFNFINTAEVKINLQQFNLYKVVSKNDGVVSNNLIEVIKPQDLYSVNLGNAKKNSELIWHRFEYCIDQNYGHKELYLSKHEDQLKDKITTMEPQEIIEINYQFENKNKIKVETNSKKDSLFKIKLTYFPWLRAIDENGKELLIIEGYPHFYVVAKNNFFIISQKPKIVLISYGISILSILILVIVSLSKRKFL